VAVTGAEAPASAEAAGADSVFWLTVKVFRFDVFSRLSRLRTGVAFELFTVVANLGSTGWFDNWLIFSANASPRTLTGIVI